MPDRVITNARQITAEWLTIVLSGSGALMCGQVASLRVGDGQGNWSASVNLAVTYTDEARGPLPQRLFLKMVNCDTGDDEFFGESEVMYYVRDYVDVNNAPLIRCYDAVHSKEL